MNGSKSKDGEKAKANVGVITETFSYCNSREYMCFLSLHPYSSYKNSLCRFTSIFINKNYMRKGSYTMNVQLRRC